jgi:hypothetical protein
MARLILAAEDGHTRVVDALAPQITLTHAPLAPVSHSSAIGVLGKLEIFFSETVGVTPYWILLNNELKCLQRRLMR